MKSTIVDLDRMFRQFFYFTIIYSNWNQFVQFGQCSEDIACVIAINRLFKLNIIIVQLNLADKQATGIGVGGGIFGITSGRKFFENNPGKAKTTE